MSATNYTDLGLASDLEFFQIVVCADMQAFKDRPGLVETFHLASSLNHMLDWHWHSLNRGQESRGTSFAEMRHRMATQCPELKLVRDLCDGSKHCGLNRSDVALKNLQMVRGKGGVGGYGSRSMPGVGGALGYNVAGAYGNGRPETRLLTSDEQLHWCSDIFSKAFAHWASVVGAKPEAA